MKDSADKKEQVQKAAEQSNPPNSERVDQPKKFEKLSISYLFTENGRALTHLFGYELSKKFDHKSISQMGRQIQQICVNKEGLENIIKRVWPDIQKYLNIIPLMFSIFKDLGVVSLRKFDRYIQLCKETINPFMANWKQHIPTSKIQRLIVQIQRLSEKQDLRGTGLIDKLMVEELCKKELNLPEIRWDKQLVNADQFRYQVFLSQRYLRAGAQVDRFLYKMMINKVRKVMKGVIKKKKGKKKKTGRKQSGLKPPAKSSMVARKEKILKDFIENRKPKQSQNQNQTKFIAKSIIQELIFNAVEVKEYEDRNEKKHYEKVNKSIFITEPQHSQIEYENSKAPQCGKIRFINRTNIGLFVQQNEGCIIDGMHGTKISTFNIHPSKAIKNNQIKDYQLFGQYLYLLREDGLIYSWCQSSQIVQYHVQTPFKIEQNYPWKQKSSYLQVKDGIIFLNCTHLPHSRIYLYSLHLQYIGVIELNPLQYGIEYRIVEECLFLAQYILPQNQIDRVIKSYCEYETLIREENDKEDRDLYRGQYKLGKMLTQRYAQNLTIKKISEYVKWILSYRINNTITLPKTLYHNLWASTQAEEDIKYLKKYFYLLNNTDLKEFKKKSILKTLQNRKKSVITMIQDSNLQELHAPFMSRKQFTDYLAPCCLLPNELKYIFQTIQYTSSGQIDLSNIIKNQHYQRLMDVRNQNYNPQQYKILQMPPISISSFVCQPALNYVAFSTHFPVEPAIFISSISKGNLINKISLNSYTLGLPKLYECPFNNYIMGTASGNILLWKSNTISVKGNKPIRVWRNVQSQEIIDLVIIYQLQTVLTLTKNYVKIWDLDSLLDMKESQILFKVKPGYMAVQTSVKSSKECKKKIYVRGQPISLFYCRTKNDIIIPGILSMSKGTTIIKMFNLNKFTIMVRKDKFYEQVPVKLIHELQALANKKRHYTNKVHKPIQYTIQEKNLLSFICSNVRSQQLKKHKKTLNYNVKQQLQRKINRIISDYYNIFTKNIFIEKAKSKSKRYELFFEVFMSDNDEELSKILQNKLLIMYKNEEGHYSREQILMDALDYNQNKTMYRILYLISLMEKYTRPLQGCNISKLISKNRNNIDLQLVYQLLSTPLPLQKRIIQKSIKVINSFQEPLRTVQRIMKKYIPTRYRFLPPTYYKQILSPRPSIQLQQYINNRYQQEPPHIQILKRIKDNKKYNSVMTHINQQNMMGMVQSQISKLFPQTLTCNYALAQALQCYRLITQDEAIYYCIMESENPSQKLSSSITNEQSPQYNINQIMKIVYENIKKIGYEELPTPKISFNYFQNNLYHGEYLEDIFYTYFKGIRSQHSMMLENMLSSYELFDKGINLKYDKLLWFRVIGSLAQTIKPCEEQLRIRFPALYRISTVSDFKTILMNYVSEQCLYQLITYRCAVASCNDKDKQQMYFEDKKVDIDGMFVNVNYLFKFLRDYTPLQAIQIKNESKVTIKQQQSLVLPAYHIIKVLEGNHHYMTPHNLMSLLQYNINSLTLSECQQLQNKYYKYNPNFCTAQQMKDILVINECTLGLLLLNRYNRMDFEYKLTIIDHQVATKQILDIVGGPMLMDLVFPNSKTQFMDYTHATTKIRNKMLVPAMEIVINKLIYRLPNQILQLIRVQGKKNGRLPVSTIVKYIQENSSQNGIMSCLVRYVSKQSDNAQTIQVETFLNNVQEYQQKSVSRFSQYRSQVREKLHNTNIIQLFIKYAQHQHICNSSSPQPNHYIITHQHIIQILQNTNIDWLVSFQPYAHVSQFIKHIQQPNNMQQIIHKFTKLCICKYGIQGLIQLLQGQDLSFPEFFNKIRNISKPMTTSSARELCALYNYIKQQTNEDKFTKQAYFKGFQEYIALQSKIQWVSAYYDKQLIQTNSQQVDNLLPLQSSLMLLKNIYTKESQLDKVVQALNYEEYLIHKYVNDPIKLQQIYKIITTPTQPPAQQVKKGTKKRGKKEKVKKKTNYDEYKDMMAIYGLTTQHHLKALYQYILNYKDMKERIHSKTNENIQDIEVQEIKQYMNIISNEVKDNQLNMNTVVNIKEIEQSRLYSNFTNHGVGKYYNTYHAFQEYCRSTLVLKYKHNKYRNQIKERFTQFMNNTNLSEEQLYQMLSLSSYENMHTRFSVCLQPHNIDPLTIQTFVKYDDMGIQVKYPISIKTFKELVKNKQNNQIQQLLDNTNYEQLLREMDITGMGYVNINEVKRFRGKEAQPYIHILTYLNKILPNTIQLTYQPPPPSTAQICHKLLKRERAIDKYKIIQNKQCMGIFSQYVSEDYLYFISNEFKINNRQGYLNLSKIVDWLTLKGYGNNSTQQKFKYDELSQIVEDIEKVGSVIRYVKYKSSEEVKQIVSKIYDIVPQHVFSSLLITYIFTNNSQNSQEISTIQLALTAYYSHVHHWNTHHNQFVMFVKNMAQTQYTLIHKFYHSHASQSKYTVYDKISRGEQLTFFTLWKHIEKEGIVGYGRQDIQTIYNIIDINGDKEVSFTQFIKFWMACQQIFGKDMQKQERLPINNLKEQIRQLTVQIVRGKIVNTGEERVGVKQLGQLLNIKNQQKIRQIVTIMNETNINPNNGISRSKLRILGQNRVESLATKHQQTNQNNMNTNMNLLLLGSIQQLYQYIIGIMGVDTAKIKKIILTKYPTIGYRIVQYIHDYTKFNKQALHTLYQLIKSSTNNTHTHTHNSAHNENQKYICNRVVNSINAIHKKYPFNNIKTKYFGESIAQSLCNEQIHNSFRVMEQEIKQMRTLITKDTQPVTPLTYSLQNTINLNESYSILKNLVVNNISQSQFGALINKNAIEYKLYRIRESKHNRAQKIEIQWLDTDYHCKSDNSVNLMQYLNAYNDKFISYMNINTNNSGRFRLSGVAFINHKQGTYHKYTDMTISQDINAYNIMTFIQKIVHKLYHCYSKYNITGLLLNLQNILVNEFNHADILFHNLVTAFSLDENKNYCDGVDCIDIVSKDNDVAPQIWDHIYTQAIDVYQLSVIMFQLMNIQTQHNGKVFEFDGVEQGVWSYYSQIQKISKSKLMCADNSMSELQITLWNLIYECSKFDWYQRPKLYQILQTLRISIQYSQANQQKLILFASMTKEEKIMEELHNGNIKAVLQNLKTTTLWKLNNLITFREYIAQYEEGDLYQIYNRHILLYLQNINAQNPQQLQRFMSMAVNYLLTPPANNRSLCLLACSAYKTILSNNTIAKYLQWCDESWKINEFDIGHKLQQLNMENRIHILHKNSVYYHDLTTLSQCRMTLEDVENKKNHTGKKVAISFIHSAIISNNVNKVSAIYRSNIVQKLPIYLCHQEFQPTIIKILQLITQSYNLTKHMNNHRTVDEVYKVMMVIYNIMQDGSPRKKAGKQSVITMLDYLNNYYNTGGQECKNSVLKLICKEQICTYLFLSFLFNQNKQIKGDQANILLNLSYSEQAYDMLKSPIVNAYNKLKKSEISTKIRDTFCCHQETITLGELSTLQPTKQTYAQVIHKHLIFYYYYKYKWNKLSQHHQTLPISYQTNFYSYYIKFIVGTQEVCFAQLANIQKNKRSLQIVTQVIRLHNILFQFWVHRPTTIDNISCILNFLLRVLQELKDDQHLYSQNKANQHIIPNILQILIKICKLSSKAQKHQYDLMKILIDNGYIHYFSRIVKKQHQLMIKYIEKNVQKIHLIYIYPFEAQYRLSTVYYLLQQNQKYLTQIYQLFINSNFTNYLVHDMLNSKQTMDLRFYKANTDIMPYRYCNPLRAQAITIIGFIFSRGSSPLANDIVSKILPFMSIEHSILYNPSWSTPLQKMKYVQVLWFFANLTQCQDERLKYEFVNLGVHDTISQVIDRYPMLRTFFPKMTETIKTGTMLAATLSLSRSSFIR